MTHGFFCRTSYLFRNPEPIIKANDGEVHAMNQEEKRIEAIASPAAEYEAPAIESIVTSDDLAREVHYAGGITDR